MHSCQWSTYSPSSTPWYSGFDWSYFLMEPLIFISVGIGVLRPAVLGPRSLLWLAVSLRGAAGTAQPDCQDWLRRFLRVTLPWGVHERLWALKYLIFLVLFGFSLHSLELGRAPGRGRALQDSHYPEVHAGMAEYRTVRRGRHRHQEYSLSVSTAAISVPAGSGTGDTRKATHVLQLAEALQRMRLSVPALQQRNAWFRPFIQQGQIST